MQYSDYFEARKVTPEFYQKYRLPRYLTTLLSHAYPVKGSAKILDYGCGFGQTLRELIRDGYEDAEGYDIEPTALNFCRQEGLSVIDGNVDKIKRKYNLVIMQHVLEHMPKEHVIDVLRDIKNHLVDGGGVIITVPNAQSSTGSYWAYEDFTHHTLFTAGSLYYVLYKAGFTDINLLDKDCLDGVSGYKKYARLVLLKIYRARIDFWNRVTGSSYHKPSPVVNSFEIKMYAK